MASKRKRQRKTGTAVPRTGDLPFPLTGAELLAVGKAVQGYRVLLEGMPAQGQGRAEVLATLASLSRHLEGMLEALQRPGEPPAMCLAGIELRLAYDAIRAYVVAVTASGTLSLLVAPQEERERLTTLPVPLQCRLQALVQQIAPKGMPGTSS